MYTVKRIAKLLLFYSIFYSGLVAFTAIYMVIFFKTLDNNEPRWKLDESLIGSNPGLSFKPNAGSFSDGTNLITYNVFDNETAKEWIEQLDVFFEHYRRPKYSDNLVECNRSKSADPNKVCKFEIENFGNCTKEYDYGYGLKGTGPCIFFKLNKVFGWVPDLYNSTTLPDDMPEELKWLIKNNTKKDLGENQNVWLDCSGETSKDTENMGSLKYYPSHQGFPSFYFPFKNTKGYLSPLVAVYFEKPKHNVTIDIVCKAWARNIKHQYTYNHQKGSARIRLLLTEDDTN